jgi:hypothetical protein
LLLGIVGLAGLFETFFVTVAVNLAAFDAAFWYKDFG